MQGINYFKAGVLVIISLALFVLSIYIMGSEREIFSSQKLYYTIFKDVKGLSEGAPIRLGGITIGRVDNIGFAGEGSDKEIEVRMAINEKYLPKLRLDSKVTIETQGLLGDKFLSISVGQDQRLAPPGSVIHPAAGGDVTEIVDKAVKVIDNGVQISEDIKALTASIKGDTLKDLSEALKEISALTKNLNAVAGEIKNGKGLLHAMVYDQKGEDSVTSLSKLLTNLHEITETTTVLARDIKDGQGLLHDMIYNRSANEEGLGELMTRLNSTAENLKAASDSLKNGTGTLGALMVDSKIYDNLVEITDGAKRSYILKQAVRSTLQK